MLVIGVKGLLPPGLKLEVLVLITPGAGALVGLNSAAAVFGLKTTASTLRALYKYNNC